jgi:hypothetical protein
VVQAADRGNGRHERAVRRGAGFYSSTASARSTLN